MSPRSYLVIFALPSLVLSAANPVMDIHPSSGVIAASHTPRVGEASIDTQSPWAAQPVFGGDFGGFSGVADGGVAGGVFGVIPFSSTLGNSSQMAGDLWFIEPHANWAEEGSTSQSIGIGFRRLLSSQPMIALDQPAAAGFWAEGWYWGGNLFLDSLQSAAGNNHWQLGAGIEAGSRYVTLRANFYQPLDTEAKKAGQRIVQLSHTANVTEQGHLVVGPDPYRDDILYTAGRFDVTTHHRILNDVYTFYDQGVPAWDAEASFLVPKLERYTDLRVAAGIYGMDGGDFGRDVNGWRLGLELRPIPALALMATYFDDNSDDHGHWFAGFRVEIPLGKTPSQLSKPHTRHLIERLLEPTGRSNGAKVMRGVKIDKQLVLYDVEVKNAYEQQGIVNGGGGSYIYFDDGRVFEIQADGSLRYVGNPKNGDEFSSHEFSSHVVIIVIPEPSRSALLFLGCFGLLLHRKRS